MDKFEPVFGGGDMDHSEESVGQLIVAGRDCPIDLTDYAKFRGPQSVAWLNRCLDTSATCFDCCLSQEILDGGNGVLTT